VGVGAFNERGGQGGGEEQLLLHAVAISSEQLEQVDLLGPTQQLSGLQQLGVG